MTNVLPFEKQLAIAACLVEGNEIRPTSRLVGCHRDTAMRFGLRLGEACEHLHDKLVRDLHVPVLECDETWTFVAKKERRVRLDDPPEYGDQFVWLGVGTASKLVVNWRVDKRTPEAAKAFMADLRSRLIGRPHISTDAFAVYPEAVQRAFGREVDHGHVVKSFGPPTPNGPEYRHRYSPGRIRAIKREAVSGHPIDGMISTSHVERVNLTLRMGSRRFTRLCNGFSKKLRNLRAAVALFWTYYNFCRPHSTHRRTPAEHAGITDCAWSLEDLLVIALEAEAPASAA